MSDSTKQESVILPLTTIRFVEGLAKLGIYGTKKGEVLRYFVQDGVNRAITSDVMSKHAAAQKAMRKLSRKSVR